MEKKARLSVLGLAVRVWIVIVSINFKQLALLDEILVLFICHWCDALPDKLLKRLNIQRSRNQFLLPAHLQEGTDLHLSILVFDVFLAEHNPVTVHVLVDVRLEKVFERLQVSEVDFNGILGKNIDGVLSHLG